VVLVAEKKPVSLSRGVRGWFGSLKWYSWIFLAIWLISIVGGLAMAEGLFYEGEWLVGSYILAVPIGLFIIGILWAILVPKYVTPYIEKKWGKGRPIIVYIIILIIFLAWLTIYLST
jgi:hypothetical protein